MLTWVPLSILFTLSGLLAAKPSGATVLSSRAYLARRFVRLYPAYVIALASFMLLGVFPLTWSTFAVNLALLGPWIGPATPTLWFVEVLLYFHALHALWTSIPALRRHSWTMPLLAAAITAAVALVLSFVGLSPDPRLVTYLPAFVGGVCLGTHSTSRPDAQHRGCALAVCAASVLAGTLGALMVPAFAEQDPMGFTVSTLTMLIVGAIISLPQDHWPHRIRRRVWVERLAIGSYMAYLAHRVVFLCVSQSLDLFGEVAVFAGVLMSCPFVLILGVWLQDAYDNWVPSVLAGRRRARRTGS